MTASIPACFAPLKDPRVARTRRHSLEAVLVIGLCAVIAGADGWKAMATFGRSKLDWFKTFLDLPHGIPSADTFRRVFARLDPLAFEDCFLRWVQAVAAATAGQVIAIDGQTLRRSFDTASEKACLHLVSAWAAKNALTLAQVKTEAKSNEITAIPQLLKLLDLHGCTVTIDAMGCQKKIAAQIVAQHGDYVFGLKGNQGGLLEDVKRLFDTAQADDWYETPHDAVETVEKDHGRIETRRVVCTSAVGSFVDPGEWVGLRSIARVESTRLAVLTGKTTVECRYYVSSLDGQSASDFAAAIRAHWGIENKVHWVLDVVFRQDDCRVRQGHGAENLSVLRKLALNLLRHESTAKMGIQLRRQQAGWDDTYMARVLTSLKPSTSAQI